MSLEVNCLHGCRLLLFALVVRHFVAMHPELRSAAVDFAADDALLQADFGAAWSKLMNADRFQGPTGSVCAAAATRSAPSLLGAGAAAGAAASTAAAAVLAWAQRRVAGARALDKKHA